MIVTPRGIALLLAMSCASEAAAAQRMPDTPAFLTPAQPVLRHHEGRTAAAVIGTVGGTLLASSLLYVAGAESSWEKAGALTFTLPFAFAGTIVGAIAGNPDASFIAGPMVGGIIGGLIGGAVGKETGAKAERGNGAARGAVRMMGVVSVPAALGIFGLFWVGGAEY